MPTWLTWIIGALAGWALLSVVVALLLGHVFGQLSATSTTSAEIHEEVELADWSAAPLTRATAAEADELLGRIPRSSSGRAS
jgi:hypothetical protein